MIFFGSDTIGVPLLKWLLIQQDELEVAAVVTQPDRPMGRGKRVVEGPIKGLAKAGGVTVLQPEKPDTALSDWMREAGTDLGLVIAYGHILKQHHLDAPALGMWNFHGSLLPALRGASPIETALAEGWSETGMTLMQMVLKMDAGAMVDQERVAIPSGITAVPMRERMAAACVPLLQRNLPALLEGAVELATQDPEAVTYCRKLEKGDGSLDFGLPAHAVESRSRACHPWPGSYLDYGSTRLKVSALSVEPGRVAAEAGILVLRREDNGVLVQCETGVIRIGALQRPGGRMMDAESFQRGFSLKSGTKLEYASSKPWVQSEPFPYKKKT